MAKFLLVLLIAVPLKVLSAPLAEPGDLRLRIDLQLLNDSGVTNIPLNTWPIALGDVYNALVGIDDQLLSPTLQNTLRRLRRHLQWELETDVVNFQVSASGSSTPRIIRTFENTPRDDGELRIGLSWLGERFAAKFSATYVPNPFDSEEFRPDGTYLGLAIGNWMLTAGWQERWWGPSRDGSLILSSNARPTPGIAVQRNLSLPFESSWLSWIGPWSMTGFLTELDDDRIVSDAWLVGIRGSFRPPDTGLEIGFSRTAQWCGDGRPCDVGVFIDLLSGNDNRGVNVAFADEPGNQLGGFDVRWSLPGGFPIAINMQWIGEDGRPGAGLVGGWMRQLGIEYWGDVGGIMHRTHFEVSDTTAREGGFGFSDKIPNFAYEHFIYRSGYRYNGRSIGHSMDADSLSYSIGSTLIQSAGHSWNISLRHMKINQEGVPSTLHTLTPFPQRQTDLQISHSRLMRFGRVYAGLGYFRLDGQATNNIEEDVSGFIQWSSN